MEKVLGIIFPKSFAYKILFVAFLGAHVPLLAFTIYILTYSGPEFDRYAIFFLILAATLFGTVVTLYAINTLLFPVFAIIKNIKAFDRNETITPLLENRSDEIGFLVKAVNKWLASATIKIEAYQDEAEKDALTGILNRRGFQRHVKMVKYGYMMHFDIDDFKSINDKYGHERGDEVLKSITDRIHGSLRTGDIFARIGGEEFAILAPGSFDDINMIAERIIEKVRSAPIADLAVTISMGVAEFSGDIERSLKSADGATYEAKRNGKNRFVVRLTRADTTTTCETERVPNLPSINI